MQLVIANWLGWMTPELIFALLLAFALSGDVHHSVWYLVIGGLILDFTPGGHTGIYLLLLSILIGLLTYLSHQVLNKPSSAGAFVVFLGFSLALELCFALIYGAFGFELIVPAVLTALIAGMFYVVILWLGKQREVIHLG